MKKIKKNPVALVILDGLGYNLNTHYNAVYHAHPKNLLYLLEHYPSCTLKASGEAVGLMPDIMGNSAVGHMTIGTGRIIDQPLLNLTKRIADETFFDDKIIQKKLQELAKNGHNLHIMGLLSDGGVHSHDSILYALLDQARTYPINNIFIHVFLDGRDVGPKTAKKYLIKLQKYCDSYSNPTTTISIASLCGRYYAMDRDDNWKRTCAAYTMLTGTEQKKEKSPCTSWQNCLEYYYKKDITDELIPPTLLKTSGTIEDHDGVIFFNIRADRARQLTTLLLNAKLTQPLRHITSKHTTKMELEQIQKNLTHKKIAWMITGISYHPDFNTYTLYQKPNISNTLCDVLAEHNKKVFVVAETEKYAHVTYFFNGGREIQRPNEQRVLVPSKIVQSYASCPEMSAHEITQTIEQSLNEDPADFYIINYANPDMVGHSGDFDATVQAIKTTDKQLGTLYDLFIKQHNGTLFVTSDHGNAEQMKQDDGTPKTSHTTNPVYFIAVNQELYNTKKQLSLTQLADIAPYVLQYMHIPRP